MCSGARSSSAKGAMARRQASAWSWSTSSSRVRSDWTTRGPFIGARGGFWAWGPFCSPRPTGRTASDDRPVLDLGDARTAVLDVAHGAGDEGRVGGGDRGEHEVVGAQLP